MKTLHRWWISFLNQDALFALGDNPATLTGLAVMWFVILLAVAALLVASLTTDWTRLRSYPPNENGPSGDDHQPAEQSTPVIRSISAPSGRTFIIIMLPQLSLGLFQQLGHSLILSQSGAIGDARGSIQVDGDIVAHQVIFCWPADSEHRGNAIAGESSAIARVLNDEGPATDIPDGQSAVDDVRLQNLLLRALSDSGERPDWGNWANLYNYVGQKSYIHRRGGTDLRVDSAAWGEAGKRIRAAQRDGHRFVGDRNSFLVARACQKNEQASYRNQGTDCDQSSEGRPVFHLALTAEIVRLSRGLRQGGCVA